MALTHSCFLCNWNVIQGCRNSWLLRPAPCASCKDDQNWYLPLGFFLFLVLIVFFLIIIFSLGYFLTEILQPLLRNKY